MIGKKDFGRQLDALAATICGTTEVDRLRQEWQVSRANVYWLARAAIKRLSEIEAIPDEKIDTSDIPEATEADFARAKLLVPA